MYCIHCGVKLQDSASECPLCHTPVVTTPMPESAVRARYSDRYPDPDSLCAEGAAIGAAGLAAAGVGLNVERAKAERAANQE